jgi:hypothetical protein
MHLDDVTYDFDTDQWVAQRLIKARWIDRELPPPVEPPKPGHWIRKPARHHLREKFYGPIGLTAVASFAALVYALTVNFSWLISISAAVLWIGVPFALYMATRPVYLAASANDLRLLEDPEDRDTCLVEVAIFRDGECVGADRGVAWFENGRLLFNGARTSFAIGGEDVLPRREWAARGGNATIDAAMAVPLRLPRYEAAQAMVVFQPLRAPNLPIDHEERFVERLGAFRARPPQSRGPRQWPPLGPP